MRPAFVDFPFRAAVREDLHGAASGGSPLDSPFPQVESDDPGNGRAGGTPLPAVTDGKFFLMVCRHRR